MLHATTIATLPGVLIDHRQALQLLAIGTGVEQEVVCPDLVRFRRRQRPWTSGCYAPPWPLSRYLQAVQPPQAMGPIGTHHVSTPRQEHLDAPIAIARIVGGEL